MNNIVVLPLIIPIFTAAVLIFLRHYAVLQRIVAFSSMFAVSVISFVLLELVQREGILKIDFGGWEPPYGILFVADSFSVLMVLTSSVVTMLCLLYAFSTADERLERMFLYSFILLLAGGVNGSFLTGDIFNLFVCFEVMLMSSYVLAALGGGRMQLRESLKYVLINVVASSLFLIALAYLYSTVKTLNMAHIAERVAEAGQDSMLTTVALVLFIVFSLKAGLVLFFWLPGSYVTAPIAVQGLFAALLTKVGVYALIRTFTLMFPHHPEVTHTIIGIFAGITIILGCMGALSSRNVLTIAAYNIIIAVGFILIGLSVGTETAIAGSVFYLIHDMVAKALLFLLTGMMVYLTGEKLIDYMSGLIRNYPLFGWIYFLTMLALVGIPPLSGFVGKMLIGKGAIEAGAYVLLFLGFTSSVAVLFSLLKIFLSSFFGETIIRNEEKKPIPTASMISFVALAFCLVAIGLGAERLSVYVQDAAKTLVNPSIYIEAILGKSRGV